MNYTFPEFQQNILHGREVEFKFESNMYSITNTPSGFCFAKFHDADSVECFEHASELLEKVRINGKTFEEIFDQNAFELITLF